MQKVCAQNDEQEIEEARKWPNCSTQKQKSELDDGMFPLYLIVM